MSKQSIPLSVGVAVDVRPSKAGWDVSVRVGPLTLLASSNGHYTTEADAMQAARNAANGFALAAGAK